MVRTFLLINENSQDNFTIVGYDSMTTRKNYLQRKRVRPEWLANPNWIRWYVINHINAICTHTWSLPSTTHKRACRCERTSMPNRKVPWRTNKLETEIYTQHARTETSSAPVTMACDEILLHGHTANWAVRRCYELHVYYHRLLEIAQLDHSQYCTFGH